LDDVADRQEVGAFTRQRGVKYQILLGNSRTADEYGGVRFLPQSFLIDRDGTLKKALTGFAEKKDLEDAIQALLAAEGARKLARGGTRASGF